MRFAALVAVTDTSSVDGTRELTFDGELVDLPCHDASNCRPVCGLAQPWLWGLRTLGDPVPTGASVARPPNGRHAAGASRPRPPTTATTAHRPPPTRASGARAFWLQLPYHYPSPVSCCTLHPSSHQNHAPRTGSHCAIMLSKKPAILVWSYSSLPPLCYAPSPAPQGCTTSCRLPLSHKQSPQTRNYAQHASSSYSSSSSSHSHEADLSWPDAVHPHKTPTPYQILNCRRGEPYTKHRFYSLVKLYHPDRGTGASPIAHLPHTVRLERYRLLVAAHSILSDDAKRRAYDAWGHGWQGPRHASPYHPSQTWTYEQREWPPGQDPAQNATWEDWERWYHKQDGTEKVDPRDMYMSNFAFVSVVFALVTLGGIMQGTRANMLSSSVMEHRDKIHKEASMELARSKRASISGDRNERIKTFLEHREAVLTGEDAYHRILPPSETCTPDTVRKQ